MGAEGTQAVLSVAFNCVYRDWPSVRCTAVSAAIRADAAPVAVDRLPPANTYLPAEVSLRITVTETVKEPTSNASACRSQQRFLSLHDYSGRLFQFGARGGLTNQAHPLTLLQP